MTVDAVNGGACAGKGSANLTFSPELSALINSKGIEIAEMSAEHIPEAAEVERASYPEDEAASPESLAFRQANAGEFFLEARLTSGEGIAGEMVGFVCGTCCPGSELSHETMSLHDPAGPTLCIHSVVVAERFRRRGYATTMLKACLERVALTQPQVRRICLIAKAPLLHMYVGVGFALRGPSSVVHGKDPWYEMRIDLDETEPRLLRFVQVDAFSGKIFGGNPAAVFFTHRGGDGDWMQKVAIEMNLSESCFLELQSDRESDAPGPPLYALRWFTPGGEVDLCGHATLAAAHALWDEGRADPKLPVRFSTLSGVLTCQRGDARDGWTEMDFPAEHVRATLEAGDEDRAAILDALGLSDDDGKGDGNDAACFVGWGRVDVLVQVSGSQRLRLLKPDMRKLVAIDARGFIVTCRQADKNSSLDHDNSNEKNSGDEEGGGGGGCGQEFSSAVSSVFDFESRFFTPRQGIDEDPVTGSAHCCLATYWANKLGRNTLVGYQASPRGGTVRVTYTPTPTPGSSMEQPSGRVKLEGKAVTVFRGLFRG